jgi:hypothetical protein
MRRMLWSAGLAAAAVALVWGQRDRAAEYPLFEIRAVFPRETSPGLFQQVDQRELQGLADQGWELVSVVPYVYRNEERGSASVAPRPMATLTYPAYFFKRVKPGKALPSRELPSRRE